MTTRRTDSNVRKVIEPELLDDEERAELVEAQMEVRGNVKVIAGQVDKLRGRLMRSNILFAPEKIRADLVALRDEADRALAVVNRIAS